MESPSQDNGTMLDFSKVNLQGRDEESKILRSAFETATNTSCFVAGASGTGKSALIHESLRHDVLNADGFMVKGKHDHLGTAEPYCALVEAFEELCDCIDTSRHKKDIARLISESLGPDSHTFARVVPGIAKILLAVPSESPSLLNEEKTEDDELTTISTPASTDSEGQVKPGWAFERLKINFRSILEIVSSFHPVVLVLDDLQWSEIDVLDLIECLQESRAMQHFLFVGSYRDNEFKDDFQIEGLLQGLVNHDNATLIRIEGLTVSAINNIVAPLLRHDPDTTMTLAKIIHRRTEGNAFFATQFLQLLQKKNLVSYSFQSLQWQWNEDRILSETSLSGNAADMVAAKISCLDEAMQTRLQVAACLGDKFDAHLVDEIVHAKSQDTSLDESYWVGRSGAAFKMPPSSDSLWEAAVNDKLIDPMPSLPGSDGGKGRSSIRYKFSHDKMRTVAYDMIPSGSTKQMLHCRIGWFVLGKYYDPKTSEEWMLLLAVAQLNLCVDQITDPRRRLELADLNLKAAARVALKSAFFTAADFLSVGLSLLGQSKWAEHYELALPMVTMSAEYEYCCGRFELCGTRVAEVLTHARSLDDKIDAYFILIESLGVQKKGDEALALGRKLLAELKFPFPKKVGVRHLIVEYTQAKRMLKGRNDNDLLRLPEMTNMYSANALKVMMYMTTFAWFGDEMETFALLIIRTLKTSLKYGATKFTASAYSMFGVVFSKFFVLPEARRMGKLGMRMLDRFEDAESLKPRVLFITTAFLTHLSSPLHDVLNPLLRAHDAGLKTGDLAYGTIASSAYCIAYYMCGLPLASLDQDAIKFAAEMKTYSQLTALSPCLLHRQTALNLMGQSEDPLRLQGDAIRNIDAFLAGGTEIENGRTDQVHTTLMMQLCYYLGDLSQAEEMARRNLTYKDDDFPFFIQTAYPFWRGLIYLALVQSGEKKYLRRARKQIRQVEKYTKGGMINCHHMLLLLNAEYKTTIELKKGLPKNAEKRESLSKELRQLYDEAIKAASRAGFNQSCALANERAGLMSMHFDEFWPGSYLKNAVTSYSEWGATVKVDQLVSDYAEYDIAPGRLRHRSNLKGRKRFNPKNATMHRSSDCFELSSDQESVSDDDVKPATRWGVRSSHL